MRPRLIANQHSILVPNVTMIFRDFLKNYFESHFDHHQGFDLVSKISGFLDGNQAGQSLNEDKISKHRRLFKDINDNCEKLFTQAIPSSNLVAIKKQFQLILKNYQQYFSCIDDYSLEGQESVKIGQEILKNFIENGVLYERIDSLDSSQIEKFSAIAKNMIFFFNKLIHEFEEARVNEPLTINEKKQKIFLTLQKFPGYERFACLDGLESDLFDIISTLTFKTFYQGVFHDKFQVSQGQIASNIAINYERHAGNFLIHLLNASETQEQVDKLALIDIFFKTPHLSINLLEVFKVLEKFKGQNFFDQLLQDYQEIYNSDDELKELSLDPSEIFEENSKQNQVLKKLVKIFENFRSKFSVQEFANLGIDSYFFLDDQSKLIAPQVLQEKLVKLINDKLSLLYPQYFSKTQIDFFKYFPSTNDLFSDDLPNVLDSRKISNFLSLFEKIEEGDSQELKKHKLEKTASGLFALRQISLNKGFFSQVIDGENISEPLYYFSFFQSFLEQKSCNFFEFFFTQQEEIREEYRGLGLESIFEFFKEQKRKIAKITQITSSSSRESVKLKIKQAIDEQNLKLLKTIFFQQPYWVNASQICYLIKNSRFQNSIYNQGIISTLSTIYRELTDFYYQRDQSRSELMDILINDQESIFKIALQKKRFEVASDIVEYFEKTNTNLDNEIAKKLLDQAIIYQNPKLVSKTLSVIIKKLRSKQEVNQFLSVVNSNDILKKLFKNNDIENFKTFVNFLLSSVTLQSRENFRRELMVLFFESCKSGKGQFVEFLISLGFQTNTRFAYRQTPLHIACLEGHYEIVKLLLQRSDLDVNIVDQFGRTSFQLACLRGQKEIVKLLLQRAGLDINYAAIFHDNPFQKACLDGKEEIVKLLLQRRDLDVNIVDQFGQTPFQLACSRGQKEIVELLLQRRDLDVNIVDQFGRTPFQLACSRGQKEIVELLLQRRDLNINIKDRDGSTPFHRACSWHKEEIVKLLLQRSDLDVNIVDQFGQTPFQRSCSEGRKEIIELLLQRRDLDVNIVDQFGQTPFQLACSRGQKEIVELLLQRADINVNVEDQFGRTPIKEACSWGYEEILELLLQRPDLKIDHQADYSLDALNNACKNGKIKIVKLLLQRGVDVHKKNIMYRKIPLEYACINNCKEVVDLLLKEMSKNLGAVEDNLISSMCNYAREKNQTEILELLTNFSDKLAQFKKEQNQNSQPQTRFPNGNQESFSISAELVEPSSRVQNSQRSTLPANLIPQANPRISQQREQRTLRRKTRCFPACNVS
jgi:ankyrin repeat protein